MAFTERYFSVAGAGAHDGTSEADAWTFDEMISALTVSASGVRANGKTGSYSIGTTTIPAASATQPFVIRFYNSTIGDLDIRLRDATGELVDTNYPTLTLTGIMTRGAFSVIMNANITGALSSQLMGDTTTDDWGLINCKVTNTQNNAAASCIHADDRCWFYNFDFECSGAAHSRLVLADTRSRFMFGRLKTAAAANCLEIQSGHVERCIFHGHASAIGLDFDTINDSGGIFHAVQNTFYGIGTAIQLNNAVPAQVIHASHNHATDCAKWLDNLGSGSRNVVVVESYNRLRDITTPRTGIESIPMGEITTDTGGAETDFVDAGGGDFHLIPAAPGYAAGLYGQDIGAEQHDVPSGGGGGGGPFHGPFG